MAEILHNIDQDNNEQISAKELNDLKNLISQEENIDEVAKQLHTINSETLTNLDNLGVDEAIASFFENNTDELKALDPSAEDFDKSWSVQLMFLKMKIEGRAQTEKITKTSETAKATETNEMNETKEISKPDISIEAAKDAVMLAKFNAEFNFDNGGTNFVVGKPRVKNGTIAVQLSSFAADDPSLKKNFIGRKGGERGLLHFSFDSELSDWKIQSSSENGIHTVNDNTVQIRYQEYNESEQEGNLKNIGATRIQQQDFQDVNITLEGGKMKLSMSETDLDNSQIAAIKEGFFDNHRGIEIEGATHKVHSKKEGYEDVTQYVVVRQQSSEGRGIIDEQPLFLNAKGEPAKMYETKGFKIGELDQYNNAQGTTKLSEEVYFDTFNPKSNKVPLPEGELINKTALNIERGMETTKGIDLQGDILSDYSFEYNDNSVNIGKINNGSVENTMTITLPDLHKFMEKGRLDDANAPLFILHNGDTQGYTINNNNASVESGSTSEKMKNASDFSVRQNEYLQTLITQRNQEVSGLFGDETGIPEGYAVQSSITLNKGIYDTPQEAINSATQAISIQGIGIDGGQDLIHYDNETKGISLNPNADPFVFLGDKLYEISLNKDKMIREGEQPVSEGVHFTMIDDKKIFAQHKAQDSLSNNDKLQGIDLQSFDAQSNSDGSFTYTKRSEEYIDTTNGKDKVTSSTTITIDKRGSIINASHTQKGEVSGIIKEVNLVNNNGELVDKSTLTKANELSTEKKESSNKTIDLTKIKGVLEANNFTISEKVDQDTYDVVPDFGNVTKDGFTYDMTDLSIQDGTDGIIQPVMGINEHGEKRRAINMTNEQGPSIIDHTMLRNYNALQSLKGVSINPIEGNIIEFNHTFIDYAKTQKVIKDFPGFDDLVENNKHYNAFQVDLTKITNEITRQENELAVLNTKVATITEKGLQVPEALTNAITQTKGTIEGLKDKHTNTTEKMFTSLLQSAPEETKAQLIEAMEETNTYKIIGNALTIDGGVDEQGEKTNIVVDKITINGQEITMDENGLLSIVEEESESATATITNKTGTKTSTTNTTSNTGSSNIKSGNTRSTLSQPKEKIKTTAKKIESAEANFVDISKMNILGGQQAELQRINENIASQPAGSFTNYRGIYKGIDQTASATEQTRRAQSNINEILTQEGLSPIAVDGKWGPATQRSAIQMLQLDAGTNPDGIIGPASKAALKKIAPDTDWNDITTSNNANWSKKTSVAKNVKTMQTAKARVQENKKGVEATETQVQRDIHDFTKNILGHNYEKNYTPEEISQKLGNWFNSFNINYDGTMTDTQVAKKMTTWGNNFKGEMNVTLEPSYGGNVKIIMELPGSFMVGNDKKDMTVSANTLINMSEYDEEKLKGEMIRRFV